MTKLHVSIQVGMSVDQILQKYVWLTVTELLEDTREEWRFYMMASGGRFVMMVGTKMKPELHAGWSQAN